MYLENILEDIKIEISKLKKEIISLKNNQKNSQDTLPVYAFITDLKKIPFWPYSPSATRKMITRGKLINGIHYTKLDGKIICNISSLKDYIEKNFITLKRTA